MDCHSRYSGGARVTLQFYRALRQQPDCQGVKQQRDPE
jgi:hypothetical protein